MSLGSAALSRSSAGLALLADVFSICPIFLSFFLHCGAWSQATKDIEQRERARGSNY